MQFQATQNVYLIVAKSSTSLSNSKCLFENSQTHMKHNINEQLHFYSFNTFLFTKSMSFVVVVVICFLLLTQCKEQCNTTTLSRTKKMSCRQYLFILKEFKKCLQYFDTFSLWQYMTLVIHFLLLLLENYGNVCMSDSFPFSLTPSK